MDTKPTCENPEPKIGMPEKAAIQGKQAEAAFPDSKELYRTFINATSDMVFLKDAQLRHIVVNQPLAVFFGKPEADIIGKTDDELMPQIAADNCRASDLSALENMSIVVSEETVGDQVYETHKFPVMLGCHEKGVGGDYP